MSNGYMDSLYREIILEHWNNPQNKGILKHPTNSASVLNSNCGDKLLVTLEVKKDIIKDVRFDGETCAISQASASLFSEEIKGKSVKDIVLITPEIYLAQFPVQLTARRINCALLFHKGLLTALSIKSDNIVV